MYLHVCASGQVYLVTISDVHRRERLQSESITRCAWAGADPLLMKYHDREWGVPLHDDRALFEFLILDGFQAGLSWAIILNKRQNYRRVFDNFEAQKMAKYDSRKIKNLLGDAGIVRNRLKIEAAIKNARGFLAIQ